MPRGPCGDFADQERFLDETVAVPVHDLPGLPVKALAAREYHIHCGIDVFNFLVKFQAVHLRA